MSTHQITRSNAHSVGKQGMRPRKVRRILISAGAGAVLAGAALGFGAGKAHADPFGSPAHQHDMLQACGWLATYPTLDGVNSWVLAWMRQYGTSDSAIDMGASTLVDAVTYDCQQYGPLVKAWADLHHTSTGGGATV